ncbi:amino acid transporter [Hansschlegelia sp. KR7-227]|uniref:amino acid transporter n=1 Tax=Hansschlegelia sp. KR7-227 TaxID=3400914 RepID=UPI003C0A0203
MGDLSHNERLKLTATYVNGLAIAVAAVGGFAPIFSMLAAQTAPTWLLIVFVAVCFPFSIVLHLVARRALRGLRE